MLVQRTRGPAFLSLAGLCLLIAALAACSGGEEEQNPFGIKSELVTPAAHADALAFAPDGRLFYAEHWNGNIRIVTADGKLLPDPFAHVESGGVYILGLTGLAIDPDFEQNHYVYAYFMRRTKEGPPPVGSPLIVRFTDSNNVGIDPKVIVSDFPETDPDHPFGVNGSIHFGPDGFLYITLGDYDLTKKVGPLGKELAQDLGTPAGKLLRVNKEDGSPAPANPFAGQPGVDERIYAYGFHAPFDFDFHPDTGKLYGRDGTGVTCEELNIVEAGGNYGWPYGEFPWEDCNAPGQVPPIHYFHIEGREPNRHESEVAVNGMEFISGSVYPTLGDSLLICESRTGFIRRLTLTAPDFRQVTADDPLVEDCYLDIAVSPSGVAYYSNREEIRRLLPSEPKNQ